MKNIITSTEKGREGLNVSYLDEQKCGKKLLVVLPKDWKVSFTYIGLPVFDTDVKYLIDREKKLVRIGYCQNLSYWWKEIVEEIKQKI